MHLRDRTSRTTHAKQSSHNTIIFACDWWSIHIKKVLYVIYYNTFYFVGTKEIGSV